MKAAVLVAPERIEVTEDWPEPSCGPDEVVVEMESVAVCGSDLALYRGRRSVPALPWVMGHEGVGRIVETGPSVRTIAIGERVVIEPNFPCLHCHLCAGRATAMCHQRQAVGLTIHGLLVERFVLPAEFAWRVPLDMEGAAFVEPYTVCRSALRRAGLARGASCLVVGAGGLGLVMCVAILRAGAYPVVMEPQGDRREKARAIGARIADTNEDGFDLSFELSGTDGGRAAALSRVKRDGVVTLLASTSGNLPVDVMEIVRRRLTVRGALIYDHPADFQDSLRELCGAGASLDSASGYAFRIEECNTAFSSAIRNPGKAIVTMNQDNGYGLQKGE